MNLVMLTYLSVTGLLMALINDANSAVYTNLSWPVNDVKVCFADEGTAKGPKYTKWKSSQMQLVKDTVLNEYTIERTGMMFSGFEHCDRADYQSNIIIYLEKVSKAKILLLGGVLGQSTVGRTFFYVDKKYPGATGKIILTTAGLNYTTIIHEFGHSAGLLHEHEHYMAHELDRCKHTSKKNIKMKGRNYTDYDFKSVMNYCAIQNRLKDIGLSQGDTEAIRLMYENKTSN